MKRLIAVTIICMLLLTSCGRYSKGDKLAKSGIELYNDKEYSAALDMFRQAEADGLKSVSEAEFYSYYGDALFRMEQYEDSIAAHSIALESNPKLFSSWVTIGICEKRLGNNTAARKAYSQALICDPKNGKSVGLYISLGALSISEGRAYTAIFYLDKAKDIAPEHPAAHAYLAIAYAMIGDSRSAEELQYAAAYGYNGIYAVREQIMKLHGSTE